MFCFSGALKEHQVKPMEDGFCVFFSRCFVGSFRAQSFGTASLQVGGIGNSSPHCRQVGLPSLKKEAICSSEEKNTIHFQ